MLIDLERKIRASSDLLRLGILLELLISLVRLEYTLESIVNCTGNQAPIHLSRLQKSIASTTSRRFREEPTQPLAPFLAETMGILRATLERCGSPGQGAQTAFITRLRDCLYFLSDLVSVTHSTTFDEATFQVYLGLGRSLLTTLESNVGAKELEDTMKRGLGRFAPFWQLHSGQSMELIWSHVKPPVPATLKQLKQAIEIEDLAQRFDAHIWTSDVPLEMLERTRQMIAQLQGVPEVNADGSMNSVEVSSAKDLWKPIAYSGSISPMHYMTWRHNRTLMRVRESRTCSRNSKLCVSNELPRPDLMPPESMIYLRCSPVSLQGSFSKARSVPEDGNRSTL